MRIAIGETSALCRQCAADEFEALPRSGGLLGDKRFKCVVCESEYDYGQLLMQISEQAVRGSRKIRKLRH